MYVVYSHITGDILYAATSPSRFTFAVSKRYANNPELRVGTSNGTKFDLW